MPKKIIRYLAGLPRTYRIAGVAIVLIVAILTFNVLTRKKASSDTPAQVTHVSVQSVAGLSSASGPLPVTGKVTSLSEATILSQTSGEITSLPVAIGSYVPVGGVIAQFENSSQRAAVLQAQGAHDAAAAMLAKATGTGATNSDISSSQAAQGASNAQASLQAALQSAYITLDDAVHTKADALFSNPRTTNPQLNFTSSDAQLIIDLKNKRVQLDAVVSDAHNLAQNVTADNADASAEKMIADARTIQAFLDNLITALNSAITSDTMTPSTIVAYQASIGGTRSSLSGTVSSVTGAKAAFDSASSGASVAANSAGSGTTNDIAAAQANLKQAQGALDAARANLEKTIVRSPISGTIVSLPVSRGDYVGGFSQVAIVSNPGALEIITNVTPEDAKSLEVGGKVTIEDAIAGSIVSIAPALDPTTNKIEVKIGITGDRSNLTSGETVSLTLTRRAITTTTANAAPSASITIPIIAAKITPQGPIVFTVTASSTLLAHPIKLGSILGEQVVVATGLTPDMEIVTDARGLAEGEKVEINTQ